MPSGKSLYFSPSFAVTYDFNASKSVFATNEFNYFNFIKNNYTSAIFLKEILK